MNAKQEQLNCYHNEAMHEWKDVCVIMSHHITGIPTYKLSYIESESSLRFFSDLNNSSVSVGSASPGPGLSTDPQLFHISLNLAVLWWSSRYAGLIDFRGPQGRSTMQFWGGNPRSYQRDLQDCWYYWFHKYYNPLLPKLCHCGFIL